MMVIGDHGDGDDEIDDHGDGDDVKMVFFDALPF